METTEIALLQGARKLDRSALAEIYDRYSTGIYHYAMRMLGDDKVAEDCVSETFSKFLHALHQGKGPQGYLQAYLYRIAHNWITDFYRAGWKEADTLDERVKDDESRHPSCMADEHFRRESIRKALAQITREQRQVIVLKFLEDWENEEIARVVQKPVGAVKALQHRGLNALRRIFEREEASDEGQ
jgi:RNA polymerase sigma-70 factor (ECF subfamily)